MRSLRIVLGSVIKPNRMLRITIPLAIVTAFGASLTACGKSQLEWKEEVQLQSGEVIVVKRTAKTKAFGEIGGPGGWENKGMMVEVIQPQKPDNPPIWNFPFVPLIFDRDPQTQQWFMVATFYSCESWYALGKPNLPYTEYRLENKLWVQQPLSPQFIGRPANMLTSIRSSGEPDHTIASKTSADSDTRIAPEFRTVVGKWSTGC